MSNLGSFDIAAWSKAVASPLFITAQTPHRTWGGGGSPDDHKHAAVVLHRHEMRRGREYASWFPTVAFAQ